MHGNGVVYLTMPAPTQKFTKIVTHTHQVEFSLEDQLNGRFWTIRFQIPSNMMSPWRVM